MKYTPILLLICHFILYSQAANIFYGLNYGVNRDNCPSYETVQADFRVLKQYTNRIRVYTLKDCNLGVLALRAAQYHKMRIYLGMWVDGTNAFDQELQSLKDLVRYNKLYNVEAIIVGSEVLYRGDLKSWELVDRINQVKAVTKVVPVTTSEVYYKITSDVANVVDFMMMNAFIYWEGTTVEKAAQAMLEHYRGAQNLSQGKLVRISETGWPNQGTPFEQSQPSPENQKQFMLDTLCMTKKQNIDMIWFSAIDEPYKPDREAHFGLLDSNRQLKIDYNQLIDPCMYSKY
ncbi:glycoside hydrolase superfamily [Pilobolus umbonatus]|nr:glycoside hydrolase superfamily [Pilobolus umbonatus]